jgi:hypothetical protein
MDRSYTAVRKQARARAARRIAGVEMLDAAVGMDRRRS